MWFGILWYMASSIYTDHAYTHMVQQMLYTHMVQQMLVANKIAHPAQPSQHSQAQSPQPSQHGADQTAKPYQAAWPAQRATQLRQPSPAQPTSPGSPAQRPTSPAQPSQPSPAQPSSAQPSPAGWQAPMFGVEQVQSSKFRSCKLWHFDEGVLQLTTFT